MWDDLVKRSNEGTLFHTLKFLSYHEDRFRSNEHHLIYYNGEAPCGGIPLAIFEEAGKKTARSPFGASCGGPFFDRVLNYEDSMLAVELLLAHLIEAGVASFRVTLPLRCYYRQYSDTFRLALLEHGFLCMNRDISSVVCLSGNSGLEACVTSRLRNATRKAEKSGVVIKHRAPLDDFWFLLSKTYEKLNLKPTHTMAELRRLSDMFPDEIYFDVAYLQDRPLAGIAFFVLNKIVNSSFYLCHDSQYQQYQALSLLVYESLKMEAEHGFHWFDFGTSSLQQKGSKNLFLFKESFGAVGEFRESYEWRGQ
ncbi:MAG: GNAT family N-acetyltransferase [Deltaproteobacteria bacterium]|nr:GNAT family N-acetyltransferase [Deltaproteobacteria bacterium]